MIQSYETITETKPAKNETCAVYREVKTPFNGRELDYSYRRKRVEELQPEMRLQGTNFIKDKFDRKFEIHSVKYDLDDFPVRYDYYRDEELIMSNEDRPESYICGNFDVVYAVFKLTCYVRIHLPEVCELVEIKPVILKEE